MRTGVVNSLGTRAKQAVFGDLERRTRQLRAVETSVVPGLLQTPTMPGGSCAVWWPLHGAPDDVEAGVRARMERARILDDPEKTLDIVLGEPVLYARICPSRVMVGRLDRIVELIARKDTVIGIVPLHVRLPAIPEHGFWIFDDDRVNVETIGAELSLTDHNAIEPYRRVFAELSRAALRRQAALRLVARARYQLVPDRTGMEDGNAPTSRT
ncbi:DUF5753 domain-containing protein [Thermobifida fusca]|uniref:DUF5753 domain-containing protein n=1 Tax=Thermobifida fusca TaxID=2021 RepID=UPI001F1D79E5|nr:DUF5753 domain-containing protein [Thermobifida fusca]